MYLLESLENLALGLVKLMRCVIFILAVFIFLGFFSLHNSLAVSYELLIINNSQEPIEEVRLWGRGVEQVDSIHQIKPGEQAYLTVGLSGRGELRFLVYQGVSRIDALIISDVADLKVDKQSLTVEDSHHFILGDR